MRKRGKTGILCCMLLGCLLLVTSCGGNSDEQEISESERIRTVYQTMNSCTAEAVITCDQSGSIWSAKVRCLYIPNGESQVDVLEPETIAGVQAAVSDTDWLITYGDICLNAGTLSHEKISPIACLPQLFSAMREGWLLEENTEDWNGVPCLRLMLDQTGTQGGKIYSTLWLRLADAVPLHGELTVDQERILQADFTSFILA